MTPGHGKPRILVIDDEADIRETLDALLCSVGYEVSTAENGGVAVERAEREHFDLVITDLRMPGMSGVETVAALRRIKPGLSVIVVSGYVSDASALRCREEGALQIVAKPFDIDDLLHIVEVALRDRPSDVGGR
jgi:two-component system response regulator PilR (NtrC family)